MQFRGLLPCAVSLTLLCSVACPASSSEPPPKLVVSEDRYIGYATVADALAGLRAQGLMATPGPNGDLSFVEPDDAVAWTFAGQDDPAYPSAVRYVYTKSTGVLHAELTILCEASPERCEKFRAGIRENLAQLSKMMAGDRSANCSVKDGKMKCGAGADPENKPAE